jgi:transposase
MHANARLTPIGRLTLCLRIEEGRPVAHVAPEMGISRATGYKWWKRFCEEGVEGLADRSSRPHRCPHRTAQDLEAQIRDLRSELKLGPARIGYRLGVAPSTVHRVLVRLGLNRLAWMDRPTGRVIRRYERARPGELIHVDIKKLGKIPDGGGWKVLGRQAGNHNNAKATGYRGRVGYGYIHSAVDDHSRLAYSEILSDERKETAAGFWRRARDWYLERGIVVEEVLTDNGSCYRSRLFDEVLGQIKHRKTKPYRPQTNGKVCEHAYGAAPGRSDPGQGMTKVSFARYVDRLRCCPMARTGRTELT